ncbi:DUF3291 domain-containing protein [Nocardiopsis sp. NRRL B-16309]|uniref:DUF3291 domain-containing protein n=1 Tax=Nocardiopsis sp. NRRL B-16309 TaxID=1519494 RepID=UPI0006AE61FA|nr:DUF3291 domain-containing protein [Nocardiopsis sp. NRRL B-16309]KOX24162.1 hypothetical protein ADL05_00870 [Nocardiopsis sp. NRRL B-16309]
MPSLIPHQRTSVRHSVPTARSAPAPVSGAVLAEARTLTTPDGDHCALFSLVLAMRRRAEDHSGYLEEVHFSDEGNRVRIVSRWRSAEELRVFVEQAHDDLLDYRAASGGFPTVERTLWWSPADTEVTAAEADRRTEHLRAYGPGPYAFTLAAPVPRPAEPRVT